MRLLFRLVGVVVLTLVLGTAVVMGDLAFNNRRLLYTVLGRDALIAACRPALVSKLGDAGFQPTEVAFGDAPDIALSTTVGRTLTDSFTFEDGVQGTRVDGLVACVVRGDAVTVDVRTRSTPLRAT